MSANNWKYNVHVLELQSGSKTQITYIPELSAF